jgi:hypothetical protein
MKKKKTKTQCSMSKIMITSDEKGQTRKDEKAASPYFSG